MDRALRLVLVMIVVLAHLLLNGLASPTSAFAQRAKIEPVDIALRTSDLPPEFAVTKEETKPMDPGPGVLYVMQMERPLTNEALATGPVMVTQLIGRFDGSVSYEGFLDSLRKKAIDSDGFEPVPGAPNDGGTSASTPAAAPDRYTSSGPSASATTDQRAHSFDILSSSAVRPGWPGRHD